MLGGLVGIVLAVLSAYRVDFATTPPKLTERERPTYTAGTQLEVTSAQQPYYRTEVDVTVVAPTPAQGTTTTTPSRATTLTESETPEVNTLIAAANYYPYVIEGDAVKRLRERLYGPLEGEVTATAIGATITPSRQEPGRLPFIQLIASSDTPQHAIDLAQQTADAFIRFVKNQQAQRKIRPAQRLIVTQLRAPNQTFATGGTSLSLPVLIFVALLMVGVGIAFMLDRAFPRRAVIAPAHEDDDFVRRGRGEEPLVAASRRRDA